MHHVIVRVVVWICIIVYLLWHVFISAIVLDPMGLIPILFAGVTAVLLYARHVLLPFSFQAWAIYLVMSSSIKLLGMYMQSRGAITFEWSTMGLIRSLLFLLMGICFWILGDRMRQHDDGT